MLTPTEIIEKSNAALLAQGALAKKPGRGLCFYASPDNELRCGVGLLVSREDALILEEKLGAIGNYTDLYNQSEFKEIFARHGIDIDDPEVFGALIQNQVYHDRAKSFQDWKSEPCIP